MLLFNLFFFFVLVFTLAPRLHLILTLCKYAILPRGSPVSQDPRQYKYLLPWNEHMSVGKWIISQPYIPSQTFFFLYAIEY